MATPLARDMEPIPGYRLIDILGEGGFGQVWKAEAPGGILKAIKFVYGNLNVDLSTDNNAQACAQQELKALNRVKTVRHPYILSLERFDIVKGQLMIVMELAESNLWQRFQDCRKNGLPGIPRDEMLRYMSEIAEALDLMNIEHNLQHLDIKPQNLFLVYNHIKIGDFGLVKDLEGVRAKATSGVTPVYAAPETFEGVVSRHCDQYNLAIVYQELLTGQRPFNGTSSRQLLMQHLQGVPNLESLPDSDRPIIAKALSKKPEDRHTNCKELVRLLWQSNVTDNLPAAPGTVSMPISALITQAAPLMPSPSTTRVDTFKQPIPPVTRPETTGDGVLHPAVIIGVGGTGLQVLHDLRQSFLDRHGSPRPLPIFRFIGIDTDPTAGQAPPHAKDPALLSPAEFLHAPLQKPSYYLRPTVRPTLETWMDSSILQPLPRAEAATHGLRSLGRLALVDNYRAIAARLRDEILGCTEPGALNQSMKKQGLGLRSNQPKVYIIAGLAGGTGSGMFLDLAYIARHQLQQLGFARTDVCGVLLAPLPAKPREPDDDQPGYGYQDYHDYQDYHADRAPAPEHARGMPETDAGVANTVAALGELHHFSLAKTTFSSFFNDGRDIIIEQEKPFLNWTLVSYRQDADQPRPVMSFTGASGRAASFLARTLLTSLGRTAEAGGADGSRPASAAVCRCFGLSSISMPRRRLLAVASRTLATRMIDTWITRDPQSDAETKKWIEAESATRCLSAGGVESRFRAEAAKALTKPLPTPIELITAAVITDGPASLLKPAIIDRTLEHLDIALGRKPDQSPQPRSPAAAPSYARAFDQAEQSGFTEMANHFYEMMFSRLAEPGARLRGAETVRDLVLDELTRRAAAHGARADDFSGQADAAMAKLREVLHAVQRRSLWLFHSKATTADEIRDLLMNYPALRLEALIQSRVKQMYDRLTGKLTEQGGELEFCRTRLSDLKQAAARAERAALPGASGTGREVFPRGGSSFQEATALFLAELSDEDVIELDRRVEQVIRKQFCSLHDLCMHPTDRLPLLLAVIHGEIEAGLAERLGNENVAKRYLAQYPRPDKAIPDITRMVEEAAPLFREDTMPVTNEKVIVSLPDDPAGDQLLLLIEAVGSMRGKTKVLDHSTPDDVLIYREQPEVACAELPHLETEARKAYTDLRGERRNAVHSRIDVSPWLLPFPADNG